MKKGILFLFLFFSILFGEDVIPQKEITFTDIKNFKGILSELEMEEEIQKIKDKNEMLKKYKDETEYERRLREKFEGK